MILLQCGKATQTGVDEPALVFPVRVASSRGKRFLGVFAHPRRYGIEILQDKPSTASSGGNLATVCRTWGQSVVVSQILFERDARVWWIKLGANPQEPLAYIRLIGGSLAELMLIEVVPDPCIRMRFSTMGIYTKRRPVDFMMPHMRSISDDHLFDDITQTIELQVTESPDGNVSAGGAPACADTGVNDKGLLPTWQRDARDRLSRRLKTLRKALVKRRGELPSASDILRLEREARALVEENRGSEINAAFTNWKKMKKTADAIGDQLLQLESSIDRAEKDLDRLRRERLTETEVGDILVSHGIKSRQINANRTTVNITKSERTPQVKDQAKDQYEFLIRGTARILVAKDARSGDRLVKSAKANDWWFHVVEGTGSHVIVPAIQATGTKFSGEIPDYVARAAGILALHNSRLRDSKSGEVYVTRKASLRKKKGDPPGLWQVLRSSTMMIRYDSTELEGVLQCLQNR